MSARSPSISAGSKCPATDAGGIDPDEVIRTVPEAWWPPARRVTTSNRCDRVWGPSRATQHLARPTPPPGSPLLGRTRRATVPRRTPMPRRVSVLIPCYRQAGYLPEAVRSALDQTSTDVEIVIIDDGSPDDTARIAGELVARDPSRVRLVRQENRGLAMARAAGFAAAQGEFLVFLDADDLLERDMVA